MSAFISILGTVASTLGGFIGAMLDTPVFYGVTLFTILVAFIVINLVFVVLGILIRKG